MLQAGVLAPSWGWRARVETGADLQALLKPNQQTLGAPVSRLPDPQLNEKSINGTTRRATLSIGASYTPTLQTEAQNSLATYQQGAGGCASSASLDINRLACKEG
jgi:hypothetical protein